MVHYVCCYWLLSAAIAIFGDTTDDALVLTLTGIGIWTGTITIAHLLQ